MTKFSTGLLDRLFGKLVAVDLPGPSGQPVRRQVTEKWLEHMTATGKIHKVETRQAASAPFMIRMVATTSYIPLLDRFPLMREIRPEHWDAVFTIASLHAAVMLRAQTEADFAKLTEGVDSIHPQAFDALADCSKFVEQSLQGEQEPVSEIDAVLGFALGAWVLWNSLGRQPSKDEYGLASAIGALAIKVAREV